MPDAASVGAELRRVPSWTLSVPSCIPARPRRRPRAIKRPNSAEVARPRSFLGFPETIVVAGLPGSKPDGRPAFDAIGSAGKRRPPAHRAERPAQRAARPPSTVRCAAPAWQSSPGAPASRVACSARKACRSATSGCAPLSGATQAMSAPTHPQRGLRAKVAEAARRSRAMAAAPGGGAPGAGLAAWPGFRSALFRRLSGLFGLQLAYFLPIGMRLHHGDDVQPGVAIASRGGPRARQRGGQRRRARACTGLP